MTSSIIIFLVPPIISAAHTIPQTHISSFAMNILHEITLSSVLGGTSSCRLLQLAIGLFFFGQSCQSFLAVLVEARGILLHGSQFLLSLSFPVLVRFSLQFDSSV